mgnify:CR=1 FL=1
MSESIGGALMLRIFIVVIVLFVIFLCISANFARAFRVKNGVISIIEQYEGINDKSLPKIRNYINRMGYSCKSGEYDSVVDYVLMKKADGTYTYSGVNGKRVYEVQVCTNWKFPIIDANGMWSFKGKTEVINKPVGS